MSEDHNLPTEKYSSKSGNEERSKRKLREGAILDSHAKAI